MKKSFVGQVTLAEITSRLYTKVAPATVNRQQARFRKGTCRNGGAHVRGYGEIKAATTGGPCEADIGERRAVLLRWRVTDRLQGVRGSLKCLGNNQMRSREGLVHCKMWLDPKLGRRAESTD